jgi:hypothetical protein
MPASVKPATSRRCPTVFISLSLPQPLSRLADNSLDRTAGDDGASCKGPRRAGPTGFGTSPQILCRPYNALVLLPGATLYAATQVENITPRSHWRSYPPEPVGRFQEQGKIRVTSEGMTWSQPVINQNSLDAFPLHEVPEALGVASVVRIHRFGQTMGKERRISRPSNLKNICPSDSLAFEDGPDLNHLAIKRLARAATIVEGTPDYNKRDQ